jgi:hypothetical protein
MSCQTTFSLSAISRIWPPRFTERNTGNPGGSRYIDRDLNPGRWERSARARACRPDPRCTLAAVPLLNVLEGECRDLGTAECASEQLGGDGPVAQALVVASGAFRSACTCRAVNQFPRRTPLAATPFTRVMPLASSGPSSPLFAASTASFRTAVIRTLMETAPTPRASSATR